MTGGSAESTRTTSGCYEPVDVLVVAQGKECADHAPSVVCVAHECGFKFLALGLSGYTSMPVNYSTDLRWRAVWVVTLRGLNYQEVSKMLFISERSVRRYVDHFFSTGNIDPEKQRHGPECLSDYGSTSND